MSCSPSSWRRGACACPAAPTARCIGWLPDTVASGASARFAAALHVPLHNALRAAHFLTALRELCPSVCDRRHGCEPVPAACARTPYADTHDLQELLMSS